MLTATNYLIDSYVLQGYAWEITTVDGGWGLHGVLQSRSPVLNGVVTEWNPEADEHTPAPYSATDLSGEPLAGSLLRHMHSRRA